MLYKDFRSTGENLHFPYFVQIRYVCAPKRKTYKRDADIKGFFDHLDHEWIVRFVESRIKDPNITRLLRRFLRAGIMRDYQFEESESGSGQDSICSPILANIYMHYLNSSR